MNWLDSWQLHLLIKKVDIIMATQAEMVASLAQVKVQVTKIGTETGTLIQKVSDLEAVIASGGLATPELTAAVDALKAQVQVVDDLVPDVV